MNASVVPGSPPTKTPMNLPEGKGETKKWSPQNPCLFNKTSGCQGLYHEEGHVICLASLSAWRLVHQLLPTFRSLSLVISATLKCVSGHFHLCLCKQLGVSLSCRWFTLALPLSYHPIPSVHDILRPQSIGHCTLG